LIEKERLREVIPQPFACHRVKARAECDQYDFGIDPYLNWINRSRPEQQPRPSSRRRATGRKTPANIGLSRLSTDAFAAAAVRVPTGGYPCLGCRFGPTVDETAAATTVAAK
jgi:hypothetical protein